MNFFSKKNVDSLQKSSSEQQCFDPSNWTHAQLSDKINTSNDVAIIQVRSMYVPYWKQEMLSRAVRRSPLLSTGDDDDYEACFNEFNRRLRAYSLWKRTSQNASKSSSGNLTRTMPEPSTSHGSVNVKTGNELSRQRTDLYISNLSIDQVRSIINSSKNNDEVFNTCILECQIQYNEDEKNPSREQVKATNVAEKLFLNQNIHLEQQSRDNLPKAATHACRNVQNTGLEPRCFKMPVNISKNGARGWWYGHFNGQKICREMDFIENQLPSLRIIGIDDSSMCPISLDETGLIHKGVQISLQEFEIEWEKYIHQY